MKNDFPVILFRKSLAEEEEYQEACRHFAVAENRTDVRVKKATVIGRYSVLPFYRELEDDLKLVDSKLINSFPQHQYIANFDYYFDVEDLTPKTYFELCDVPHTPGKQYVVKGRTNSRKQLWKEKMFAENRQRVVDLWIDLSNDPLVGEQGLICREFADLEIVEEGITGMPMANEWRFFFYKENILCHEFYWTVAEKRPESIGIDGILFAQQVAKRIAPHVNFFVVDVARKKDGTWTLIEINDGQMSGLSGNNPELLYKNLALYLRAERQKD